jgi:hypothetical protein
MIFDLVAKSEIHILFIECNAGGRVIKKNLGT